MGKKYRESKRYFQTRQERLLRHKLRRKNKHHNPDYTPAIQNNKNIIPPAARNISVNN